MSGEKFIVGSPEDAEDCDYFVCIAITNPLALPDNMVDVCCRCGQAIQHRPQYPVTPKKICLNCAMPDMEEAAKNDKLRVMATEKTLQEVAEHLYKKMQN